VHGQVVRDGAAAGRDARAVGAEFVTDGDAASIERAAAPASTRARRSAFF
jgi:hypothetical protein